MKMIQKDYPYVNARVSAMRAKLLDPKDYNELLKMGPNEIARKLEEGEYSREINELGSNYEGVKLVELALIKNFTNTMQKLVEISPKPLDALIKSYLRKFDILSLKRIIRWKKGGEKGELESLLVPVGSFGIEELKDLSEKPYQEIIQSIGFIDSPVNYQEYISLEATLNENEMGLDRAYYAEITEKCEKADSQWFESFVRQEKEFEDLKIALRLKKYGLGSEEIQEWLVSGDGFSQVEQVSEAEDFEQAKQLIEGRFEDQIKAGDTLEEIEHGLEKIRLKKALQGLHIEPLNSTSILGYILAKWIEVKNLRMMIRAKETGVQNQETIKSNLVTA
ncbi:MAG: V-type ATPase subunit [Candidatus Nanohaloarchaea archaeon]